MSNDSCFNAREFIPYFKEREGDFIALMKDLVSLQTFSGEKENINRFLDFLENLFSGYQPQVSRIPTGEGDILVLTFFQEKENFLVLLAHSDTARVSQEPLSIRLENQRLFANGCYDMKAGIALFYYVLTALKHFGLEPQKQLKVIITPDEETGSRASLPFLLPACRGAAAVILPEPSCPGGGVKTNRKGVAWHRIDIKGKAVHSGIEPEKGCDANRALARFIVDIDNIVREVGEVTFNPGLISGGMGLNVVSPMSTLEFELRSFSNGALEAVLDRIKKMECNSGLVWQIESCLIIPAMEFDGKNRRLYEHARQIARDLHYDLHTCSSGGSSEGSHLSFAGIPVLDGIGIEGGAAHAPGEYIEIKDFSFRAALLTALSLWI